MKKTFRVLNLDCANCGAKIENAINNIPGVKFANLNFMALKLTIEAEESQFESILKQANEIADSIEPGCSITSVKKELPYLSKSQKNSLLRIVLAAITLLICITLPIKEPARLILFLVPYLLVGGDVLLRAVKGLFSRHIFDENFLMAVATIGAICIGEYSEGIFVMLFYQIGELFQSYAVGRSRRSISELMDIRPDYANLERDGSVVRVHPSEVEVGDIFTALPGEKIALDGVVEEGVSLLDTTALTGESVPRDIEVGSDVLSGCVNISGLLRIRATKTFGDSTVSKILDLVENASAKKARTENFITKFAQYYTPIVVLSAVLLALVPPLFFSGEWSLWIERALIFLVISCPCALVVSIPLSFFGGIGGASKLGVLVKGANYLEALTLADTVVFDKTGTLTEGSFSVTEIIPASQKKEALLELAALSEHFSNHPISLSIRSAYKGAVNPSRISEYEEIAGLGVKSEIDGKIVLTGNGRLMERFSISYTPVNAAGTVVYISVDGIYAGSIIISDTIKPKSAEAIKALKNLGIQKTVMLTGDNKDAALSIASALKIDDVYYDLLPSDKVKKVEQLITDKNGGGKLIFVGDGINDAPVLSRADIGISMGALGSDAAIEASDIVLMDDNPAKISSAIIQAKKTLSIVKQNIVYSLGVKFFILALGALGLATMWAAIFADVGVMVVAVINATRALRIKKG